MNRHPRGPQITSHSFCNLVLVHVPSKIIDELWDVGQFHPICNPSYNELAYSLLSLTLNYSLETYVASPRSNIPFITVCGYAQLNFFNRQHLRPPVCRLANAVEVERHLPVETITPTNFLAAAWREKEGGNCYWARLASWRLTRRLSRLPLPPLPLEYSFADAP